jgi:hypothetical protein
MRSVKIALAAGLVVTAAAAGGVLSERPPAVLATNAVPITQGLAPVRGRVCQGEERVPRGTSAIRLALFAAYGPRVDVEAAAGGRVTASGKVSPGWTSATVTLPVRPLARTVFPAEICFTVHQPGEEVEAYGVDTRAAVAARTGQGRVLPGRVSVEYLGSGRASWLALARSVARHMGLGRAWSGTWIVFLVAVLMLAAGVLASGLALREFDG